MPRDDHWDPLLSMIFDGDIGDLPAPKEDECLATLIARELANASGAHAKQTEEKAAEET